MAPHARVSVVIVSYNTRADLERCLRSLGDTPAAIAVDVVVVDNASGDESAGWVRANCPAVRLIEAGANLGFARANNLGIRATASELVLLLNPDTVVPPGAIDRMVGVLDRHPGVAALGPRLIDGAGNPELSWGAMISPAAEWRQKRLMHGLATREAAALAGVERTESLMHDRAALEAAVAKAKIERDKADAALALAAKARAERDKDAAIAQAQVEQRSGDAERRKPNSDRRKATASRRNAGAKAAVSGNTWSEAVNNYNRADAEWNKTRAALAALTKKR